MQHLDYGFSKQLMLLLVPLTSKNLPVNHPKVGKARNLCAVSAVKLLCGGDIIVFFLPLIFLVHT